MVRLATAVASLMLALVLIGCGGEDDETPAALVTFEVEGGIAGFTDQIVVEPDGRVLLADLLEADTPARPVSRLPPGQVNALRTTLAETPFGSLEASYHADGVADEIRYRIRYAEHLVEVDRSVAPVELRPLLRRLDAIHAGSS